MNNDDALVAEALGGDEDAFRLLVDRHRPRLYALASGILQDHDQAADAVQDAFLKAYGALAEYRGRGVFGGWMRRILVNHCLTLLRQRHHYLSLEDLDHDLAAQERNPEEQVLARNDAEAIRKAIGRLPAHYRAALVLRVVEGLTYHEIASLLAVPESTVESWIHRGRLRMRTLLRPDAATTLPAGSNEPAPAPTARAFPARLFREG